MMFGTSNQFAIEVGELVRYPEYPGLYVQFRFWVADIPIGDWDDRIPLVTSVRYAHESFEMSESRLRSPIAERLAEEVFNNVYEAYYRSEYDPTSEVWTSPDYRQRFHLDEIGMGAIQDKYGLIIVASSDGTERVIAKDLKHEQIIADLSLPRGLFESVMREYAEWGRRLQSTSR